MSLSSAWQRTRDIAREVKEFPDRLSLAVVGIELHRLEELLDSTYMLTEDQEAEYEALVAEDVRLSRKLGITSFYDVERNGQAQSLKFAPGGA